MTLRGTSIDPLYYDWIVDDEQVVYKQAPNQDDIVLPSVPVK